MEIKEITEKYSWDRFITSCPDYTFLQSWNWGEFNNLRGEKTWRLGIFDGQKQIGACQVLSVSARRGNFLFVPHGPVPILNKETFKELVNYLKILCRENNGAFLRVSPWIERTGENLELFRELGFRPAPTIMHTEETWLLSLQETEVTLLSQMRKTHRNLIRRAEKEAVEIEAGSDVKQLKVLYELQLEAATRHNFVPFSEKYLREEFSLFVKDGSARLFLAKHKGEYLAAAIIIFYGKIAFYFQSGSRQTNIPVNYSLQWEVIKEAKRRGCEVYNFWGISAENKSNERGLYMFKSGFGGFEKDYLHAQDLVLSPRYWLTNGIERIPRAWRAKVTSL